MQKYTSFLPPLFDTYLTWAESNQGILEVMLVVHLEEIQVSGVDLHPYGTVIDGKTRVPLTLPKSVNIKRTSRGIEIMHEFDRGPIFIGIPWRAMVALAAIDGHEAVINDIHLLNMFDTQILPDKSDEYIQVPPRIDAPTLKVVT
jgi:hypothetical protein